MHCSIESSWFWWSSFFKDTLFHFCSSNVCEASAVHVSAVDVNGNTKIYTLKKFPGIDSTECERMFLFAQYL